MQRIEYSSFEWSAYREWVVIYRRVSKPVFWIAWGYVALTAITIPFSLLSTNYAGLNPDDGLMLGLCSMAIGLATFGVYGLARGRDSMLLPSRVIRTGADRRLAVVLISDPQPTGMGGTLPGHELRWLVIQRPGRSPIRVDVVSQVPDLFAVNRAIRGISAANPSVKRGKYKNEDRRI